MKKFLLTLIVLVSVPLHVATPAPKLDVYFSSASFFGLDWCKETWTGRDTPFVNMKSVINKQIAQGRKPKDLVAVYKKAAQSAPQNAKAQFAYAYAAWQTSQTITDGEKIDPLLADPLKSLDQLASPHSYEYTRLHWLIEDSTGRYKGWMPVIGLGKRLIAHNPKDRTVLYVLAQELLMSKVDTDVTVEAVRYAQAMAKDSPNKASSYSLLASVYHNSLVITHDVTFADKALSAYNRYLQMTPPSYFPEYRMLVGRYIQRVEELKVQFTREKRGNS